MTPKACDGFTKEDKNAAIMLAQLFFKPRF
jgi:hypothetical protein